MNKELMDILYGEMEPEQAEALLKEKNLVLADKTAWKAREELRKSLEFIATKSKDMFGKPDMLMVNPKMHSIIKDLWSAEYLPVDKKVEKK